MANTNVSVEKKQSKVKTFFRGVWSELKKVHWPNKKQIINYTGVVLLFIFVVAIAIFAVDSILDFLLSFIIK